MSPTLAHIGATPRIAAYATAPAVRVDANRKVAPAAAIVAPAETRGQIRDAVMIERGVDGLSLFRMSSQDRIRTEAAIMTQTAMRELAVRNQARAEVKATGSLVDLRA